MVSGWHMETEGGLTISELPRLEMRVEFSEPMPLSSNWVVRTSSKTVENM